MEEWGRKMTEIAWKVAFFDDGYVDDGETSSPQFQVMFPRCTRRFRISIGRELRMRRRVGWVC